MPYSHLHRSILCACRELSRHSQTSTCVVVSLPLLFGITNAFGSVESSLIDSDSQSRLHASSSLNHSVSVIEYDNLNSTSTTSSYESPAAYSKTNALEGTDEYIVVDPRQDTSIIEPFNDDNSSSASTLTNITTNKDTNNDSLSGSSTEETDKPNNQSIVSKSNELSKSFNNDNVNDSIRRLSQFYQLQSPEQRSEQTETDIPSLSNNVINAQDRAPAVSPDIFDFQLDDSTSYRCEGVWVTPSNSASNRNYINAIQRAQQEDNLSIKNGLPLHALADYAYYDNNSYVELAGNVIINQQNNVITADQLVMDLDTGIFDANGKVLLSSSGTTNNQANGYVDSERSLNSSNTFNVQDVGSGNSGSGNSGLIAVSDKLSYNSNTNQATAKDVAFANVELQAHGYAQSLQKPDDNRYQLEKVMFSTCPPTDRKWQIEAQHIDIDTDTGRGEAYDATFRLSGVPVFYLPYFNFPVDDRRSSGLLVPNARIDSESGIKLSVPYYLNLAPNYDATLTTDVYTSRNPMLIGEFRYLTRDYGEGKLTTSFLPKDSEYDDKNRSSLFYEHNWASKKIPRLTAEALFTEVSDPNYLNDFDDFGLVDNRLNLPRRISVNYYDDYLDAQLKVETFQSLEAIDSEGVVVADKDKPYSRLPQLSIDYRLPKYDNFFDNFNFTGVHDSAYFKKSITDGSETEKSGIRIYNELNTSYPLIKSWGYINPKISLRHLYAGFDEESRLDNEISREDNNQSVLVPRFSLDSGLNFYQAGSPFGWFDNSFGGYQLLSPRLKYSYSPYEDQTSIPNFDTRIASYDYDQLFSDSWFLGYDRIANDNNLSVGLNYRYIDAMGITRFDGSIGDQFFLDELKVGLNSTEETFDSNSTGLAWQSSLQPYRNLWFDFNGALNHDNKLNYISSQVRFRPTSNSLLNFGVVERKADKLTNQSDLSALVGSAILPINQNWRFIGQGQFDSRNNKFIDSTIGLDYEDCCYGFSIYGRSYYNDLNLNDEPTRAIMGEFRIKGLGQSKGRLSKHLDDKILGFEPVDNLWKQ